MPLYEKSGASSFPDAERRPKLRSVPSKLLVGGPPAGSMARAPPSKRSVRFEVASGEKDRTKYALFPSLKRLVDQNTGCGQP